MYTVYEEHEWAYMLWYTRCDWCSWCYMFGWWPCMQWQRPANHPLIYIWINLAFWLRLLEYNKYSILLSRYSLWVVIFATNLSCGTLSNAFWKSSLTRSTACYFAVCFICVNDLSNCNINMRTKLKISLFKN